MVVRPLALSVLTESTTKEALKELQFNAIY
uniref:Uncharacterized protein n=1 Tax=Anguilla anguilla TaxID=7936 RepID=A0A0E9Q3F4_ANGAN